MKIKMRRTCLVDGFGTVPVARGTVVETESVEESKALIAAGLAVEVKDEKVPAKKAEKPDTDETKISGVAKDKK